jgi:anti-sigma factor (TIGR02949 family)
VQHFIEISCEHVWREISNYLDGDVDPELRDRMEAHFKVCSHCTAVLDGARNVVRLVADGQAFELPRGFSERLRQRITSRAAEE